MTKQLRLPSVERVREVLNYCPVTGTFTWKEHKKVKGKKAGRYGATGYRQIYLGRYENQNHARDAYLKAKSQLHPFSSAAAR